MTSAEDGGAETTQYLILQGPDDGKCAFVAANSFIFQNIFNVDKRMNTMFIYSKKQYTEYSDMMLL